MRSRWTFWLLVTLGWTLIAAVFAVSSSLTFMLTYQPPQWPRTIRTAFAEWSPWAALTVPVMWLGHRFRLRRQHWIARLVLLASAGLIVALVKLTLTRILQGGRGAADYIAITNLTTQYLIYWGIITGAHLREHYRENRERELRASQLEANLAQARLQLLQMQLQPHFLFNTLNTIAELVYENPAQAERMIAGLSQLLRETVDARLTDLVPLEREVQLLHRYVAIQRVRFGPRLAVAVSLDGSEIAAALVPTLILQPLVENAIRHGVTARVKGGRIDVRAFKRDTSLVIEVEDDGAGFDPSASREGVGLGNTRARLRELYGDAHHFDVETPPHGGTLVRLVMPWRQ